MHTGLVYLLCALGAASLACEPAKHPQPPPVEEPLPDRSPDPEDDGVDDECGQAHARLHLLRCDLPGADGLNWTAFCRDRWPAIASDCIRTRVRRVDLASCGVACPEL